MNVTQTSLAEVGFRPSPPKPQSTIGQDLQTLWEHNRAFFGEVERNVEFSRVGSHYRARFAGERTACFGETKTEAKSRLEFWRKHGKA